MNKKEILMQKPDSWWEKEYNEKGKSTREIARELSISPTWLFEVIEERNWETNSKPKAFTKEEFEELYKNNTVDEIVQKTGYTKNTIQGYVRRYQLKDESIKKYKYFTVCGDNYKAKLLLVGSPQTTTKEGVAQENFVAGIFQEGEYIGSVKTAKSITAIKRNVKSNLLE